MKRRTEDSDLFSKGMSCYKSPIIRDPFPSPGFVNGRVIEKAGAITARYVKAKS
jgi:hypothetical protein